MENLNIYLIETTTKDKWEHKTGLAVVTAKNKREAIKVFDIYHPNHAEIKSVKMFKPNKARVLEYNAPVVE